MSAVSEISKTLAGMPIEALVACVVLAGFGLAAYAIYAVLTMAKKQS